MKNNVRKQYRDLEMRVLRLLREYIEDNGSESRFICEDAIRVDLGRYVELTVIHDQLTFFDCEGLMHSVFSECTLEDLIDILYTNQ
jgi:hypothetical protein